MRRALLTLLLAACTGPEAPPPEAPGQPFGSIVVERPGAPLPPGFEILGGPCPGPQSAPPGVMVGCNPDGRVGSVHALAQLDNPADAPLAMPAGATRIPGAFGSAARVHVDTERVWVASPCIPCRVPSEQLWVVALALVSDDDLLQVQRLVGLPEAPLLRTAAAWNAALAGRVTSAS